MKIILGEKSFKGRITLTAGLLYMAFRMLFIGRVMVMLDRQMLARNGREILQGEKIIGIFADDE